MPSIQRYNTNATTNLNINDSNESNYDSSDSTTMESMKSTFNNIKSKANELYNTTVNKVRSTANDTLNTQRLDELSEQASAAANHVSTRTSGTVHDTVNTMKSMGKNIADRMKSSAGYSDHNQLNPNQIYANNDNNHDQSCIVTRTVAGVHDANPNIGMNRVSGKHKTDGSSVNHGKSTKQAAAQGTNAIMSDTPTRTKQHYGRDSDIKSRSHSQHNPAAVCEIIYQSNNHLIYVLY